MNENAPLERRESFQALPITGIPNLTITALVNAKHRFISVRGGVRTLHSPFFISDGHVAFPITN